MKRKRPVRVRLMRRYLFRLLDLKPLTNRSDGTETEGDQMILVTYQTFLTEGTREALQKEDLKTASKYGRIYRMEPIS
jgi:hypothetical protein